MWAAYNDNTEMAQLLLDKGAHMETKNKVTATFLKWLSFLSFVEIILVVHFKIQVIMFDFSFFLFRMDGPL